MSDHHRMFREDVEGFDWQRMWERQESRGALARPLFELARGRRLVDVGCGPGYFARCYQEMGADVLAIDLAPEALAFARSRGVRRTALVDAEAEPFPEKGFDAALVTNVLHHARDPLALLRHAREAAGRIVIAEFDPDAAGEIGPPREERLSPPQVARLLREAGFEPEAPVMLDYEMYAIVG